MARGAVWMKNLSLMLGCLVTEKVSYSVKVVTPTNSDNVVKIFLAPRIIGIVLVEYTVLVLYTGVLLMRSSYSKQT